MTQLLRHLLRQLSEAMRCLNCGLITRAKLRCGQCHRNPNSTTVVSQLLHRFSPKTRKLVLKQTLYTNTDNSLKSNDTELSADHQMVEQPLDLSLNDCFKEKCRQKKDNESTESNAINASNQMNGKPLPNTSTPETDASVGAHLSYNSIKWMAFPIQLSTNYIRFGTYITSGQSLQLFRNSLRMEGIQSNTTDNTFKFDIILPFPQIKELKYCPNPYFPLISIKPNQWLSQCIRYSLNLGHNSHNGLVFDIDSNGIPLSKTNLNTNKSFVFGLKILSPFLDVRQQIIVLCLRQTIDETLASILRQLLQQTNHSFECKIIDAKEAENIMLFKTTFPSL